MSSYSEFNPWDSWMIWWSYFPAAFNCPFDIRRVGNFGDGGKWVCGMQLLEASKAAAEEAKAKGLENPKGHRPCIVYSLGVATESSFEDEILEKTDCEIWAFDGSVDQMGQGNHFSMVSFLFMPVYLTRTSDSNNPTIPRY